MPVHLQGMYRKELDNMVEHGVLIPESEPTDLNIVIKPEHHYTTKIHEVAIQLNGAKFSA